MVAVLGAVAACVAKPAPQPGALALASASKLTGVDVKLNDSVILGALPRLGSETDEEVGARVVQRVRSLVELTVPSSFRGERPVRLSVAIDAIDVASGAGRVLVQSDSYMRGNVSIHDAQTGELLQSTRIVGKDEATKVGGNLGFVVSLVANAASAADEDRVEKLSEDFANQISSWLTR